MPRAFPRGLGPHGLLLTGSWVELFTPQSLQVSREASKLQKVDRGIIVQLLLELHPSFVKVLIPFSFGLDIDMRLSFLNQSENLCKLACRK